MGMLKLILMTKLCLNVVFQKNPRLPKKMILVNPKVNQCKKVKRKTIQKCPSNQKFLKIPRKVNKLVKKMNQSPAKHLMIQTLNQKSQTIWSSKKCMFTKRNWQNIKFCWPNGMKINKKKKQEAPEEKMDLPEQKGKNP